MTIIIWFTMIAFQRGLQKLRCKVKGIVLADLLKLQTLIFALYFVVPGFVILKVHEHIIPSERRNWGEALIELFGYSFFNLLICVLLAPLVNAITPIINIPRL